MSDIKLYDPSGRFPYDDEPIEEMDNVYLGSPTVTSRKQIIANKVLKYFLTEKGSDFLDPEYGVRSLPANQVAEEYFPKFKLELEEDIRRCVEYFRKRERSGKERLARINLKKLRKRDKDSEGKIELVLELTTNKNNRAQVGVR